MAKYTGNALTSLGKDLLARAIIGGEVLTFTKVELGKGIPTGTNEELTDLIDSFKVLPITSTAKLEGGSYRVRAAFSNSGITEDTYLREIGVFARGEDGIEILYSYCNTDTPDLIPAEGAGVLERVEDIITYISNAANINAVIDQSKVYATIKDLTEGLTTKEDKFSKNTAFNKNYGTGEDEISKGNHGHTSEEIGAEARFDKNSGFNLNKSDSIASTSTTTLATSKAIKTAYDRVETKEPAFSKNSGFNKSKSDSVTSTSTSTLATSKAVKTAYDRSYAKSAWTRSTSSNGYQKFPNGTIIQWGTNSLSGASGGTVISFPISFPSACRVVVMGDRTSSITSSSNPQYAVTGNYSKTSFRAKSNTTVGDATAWVAIGY